MTPDRPTVLRSRIHLGLCLAALTSACGGDGGAESGQSGAELLANPEVASAMETIQVDAIEGHIRVLAHDSLAGRAPGTPGYEGASWYTERTLRDLGLEPAGVNGTFQQPVPLLESLVDPTSSSLALIHDGETTRFEYGEDFYLGADAVRPTVEITAPVVFVGYGVSAPDFDYDDYADIDVSGKIVAYLSGAPPKLPSNPRAYYSSGATKRTEAAERGAVGMVTFTSPDDPRFRWAVSVARSSRGSFAWVDGEGTPRGGASPILGSANLNHSAANALFEGAPTRLEAVFEAAAASTPQAFDLPVELSMSTTTNHRRVDSHNVVARLEGSDPDLRDEHVVYVAHVDHFGVGVPVDGDSIYNGAHDNASGTSIVMEIARAFTSLPESPRRSVLFVIVTAEEWGLLGSDYFVEHPTVPGARMVGTFSLDMPFLFHPLKDVVPYGADHSTMSDGIEAAAAHLGIAIGPDPIPEQVLFIRSDHFSFIRRGVPALFIKSGFETGSPDIDGSEINAAWRRDVYHTPHDGADQPFDFEAGVSHARLNFLTGYWIAMQDEAPRWKDGDFFGGIFGGATP